MKKLSQELEFEEAAKVRDEMKRLQIAQLQMLDGEKSSATEGTQT